MFLFNIIVLGAESSNADGTITYCAFNTSTLPNPNDPIPADGTIIYCTQDTTELPTP